VSARPRPRTLLLLLAVALAAREAAPQPSAPQPPPAVLDALFPQGRETLPLASLAARAPLPPDAGQRVVELARDTASSHHVVTIRDRETPHRHDRHDLLVVVLEGHGTLLLGEEERPVGPGSILWVPRGSVHAFRNLAGEPAVAYAVYLPGFDGADRVEVGR
jgi:mannose-6-phosphate isomerase-like protein (cupin superfamily)